MTSPECPGVDEIRRDVVAGAIRIRMSEWVGPGASETMVLAVPGVLAPRSSFRQLGLLLGQSFRFAVVDLPGLGESEKPPPHKFEYSPRRFAEALTDLLGALGVGRAHFLGHGLGGAVVIHLATRHPELVRNLALLSPAGVRETSSPAKRFLTAPLVGELLFRQLLNERIYGSFYRDRVQKSVSTEELNEYFAALSSPASRMALLALLRNAQDARAIVADSRRLRCPSLLLWGRHDRLTPLKEGRLFARELEGAGFEILDTGHAPHVETPEVVGRILEKFFLGQRAGTVLR